MVTPQRHPSRVCTYIHRGTHTYTYTRIVGGTWYPALKSNTHTCIHTHTHDTHTNTHTDYRGGGASDVPPIKSKQSIIHIYVYTRIHTTHTHTHYRGGAPDVPPMKSKQRAAGLEVQQKWQRVAPGAQEVALDALYSWFVYVCIYVRMYVCMVCVGLYACMHIC